MEKNPEIEIGNYDFGARMYDARLGRWWSPDPEVQFVASQYQSFLNNPILHVDPDGAWIPGVDENGNIYLKAEKGDNLRTLVDFFGSTEMAVKYIDAKDLLINAGRKNAWGFRRNEKVWFRPDNPFVKATKHAAQNPDMYLSFEDYVRYTDKSENLMTEEEASEFGPQMIDPSLNTYNCHSCALGAAEEENVWERGVMGAEERAPILEKNYENVGEDKLKFGHTIITFGDQHDATFFGKDRKGNIYIFSKNGPNVEPSVMSLEWLNKNATYGGVQRNYDADYTHDKNNKPVNNPDGTGFYNKKEQNGG